MNKLNNKIILLLGELFRELRASKEVQDEYAAHLGVTQPGQGNPDLSPVLVLMDYVGDTWAGQSKHEYLKQ
jgi:hypothetical protein